MIPSTPNPTPEPVCLSCGAEATVELREDGYEPYCLACYREQMLLAYALLTAAKVAPPQPPADCPPSSQDPPF